MDHKNLAAEMWLFIAVGILFLVLAVAMCRMWRRFQEDKETNCNEEKTTGMEGLTDWDPVQTAFQDIEWL